MDLFLLLDWFLPALSQRSLLGGRVFILGVFVSIITKLPLLFTEFSLWAPLLPSYVIALIIMRRGWIHDRNFPFFFLFLAAVTMFLRHSRLQDEYPNLDSFMLLLVMPTGKNVAFHRF
jgi:hypothetical protein